MGFSAWRPGVPGVAGLFPKSDTVAVAVSVVECITGPSIVSGTLHGCSILFLALLLHLAIFEWWSLGGKEFLQPSFEQLRAAGCCLKCERSPRCGHVWYGSIAHAVAVYTSFSTKFRILESLLVFDFIVPPPLSSLR